MRTRTCLKAIQGLAIVGMLLQFACGGSSANPEVKQTVVPVTPVTVTLDAPSNVAQGGTISLKAQVAGTTNTAVTWTVNNIPNGNATVGTINGSGDSVTYTAPAMAGGYVLGVSSVSDPTKSDTAQVTVLGSAAISSVAVGPTSWTLNGGAQKQFDVIVSGTGNFNSAVTWSAQLGSITSTGLYTAPIASGSDVVTAKSMQDTSKSASSAVTVVGSSSITSILLTPATLTLNVSATSQFNLTVTGTGGFSGAVTWSAQRGSITSSGLYTAPATGGSDVVTVKSVQDTSKVASSAVTVVDSTTITAVLLTPASLTLNANAKSQFNPTVTGTGGFNGAVTWSAQRGTVTTGGLYTAPATDGTDVLRATSQADRTKYAEATVTVVNSTLPPQLGQGWTGSTSLIDYPKTGPVTTGQIVNIDDGAGGKTLEGRFLDALALLASNSTILIRNDSGAPVMLTSRLRRRTSWTSEKRIFAYGSQRITLNGSLIPSSTADNMQLINCDGSANEHWKGFTITGAPNGTIQMDNSNNMTFEDIWIHHNAMGDGIGTYYTNNGLIQDCLYWHNGTPGFQPATNSGDGFAIRFGSGCAIVRCMAVNAPDDGFDMYFGNHAKVIDCVALQAGVYFDGSNAGDGQGFKIGGDEQQGSRCPGGNTIIGSIAVNCNTGISHWQAWGAARTISHCTAYNNSYNFGIEASISGDIIDSNLSYISKHDDYVAKGTNNHWNTGSDPKFIDPANKNLLLGNTSPCMAAGSGGSTQGASVIALQLLSDNRLLK